MKIKLFVVAFIVVLIATNIQAQEQSAITLSIPTELTPQEELRDTSSPREGLETTLSPRDEIGTTLPSQDQKKKIEARRIGVDVPDNECPPGYARDHLGNCVPIEQEQQPDHFTKIYSNDQ